MSCRMAFVLFLVFTNKLIWTLYHTSFCETVSVSRCMCESPYWASCLSLVLLEAKQVLAWVASRVSEQHVQAIILSLSTPVSLDSLHLIVFRAVLLHRTRILLSARLFETMTATRLFPQHSIDFKNTRAFSASHSGCKCKALLILNICHSLTACLKCRRSKWEKHITDWPTDFPHLHKLFWNCSGELSRLMTQRHYSWEWRGRRGVRGGGWTASSHLYRAESTVRG